MVSTHQVQKQSLMKHRPVRNLWLVYSLLGLLIVSGLIYGMWQVRQSRSSATQQPTYQTTAVRRGNLSLSTSGTGTLVPAQTADLNFTIAGTLAQLNIQVGDHVSAGQVLAQLAEIDQLKLDVQNKQLALQIAQKNLDDYQSSGPKNLAQALSNRADAQAALADAQKNLHNQGDPRCDPAKTETYYYQYLYAQHRVTQWESYLSDGNTGYGVDYILQKLGPMRKQRDIAQANYTYCQGYTEQEIQASHASLQLAQANYQSADATYQALNTHQGLDPAQLDLLQAQVKLAEYQLSQSQNNLAGATLVSPMDGTVTAVNALPGDAVGTDTLISLAALDHPQLTANFDETDLQNLAVGCSTMITFDALPGRTYSGILAHIFPTLQTVNNVAAVQGIVDLKNTTPGPGKTWLAGLTATLQVTCNQVQNVLLIPVNALHLATDNQPYVYVLNNAGKPEKRDVSVGLKTATFAEISNGLSEGEMVITSPVTLP